MDQLEVRSRLHASRAAVVQVMLDQCKDTAAAFFEAAAFAS